MMKLLSKVCRKVAMCGTTRKDENHRSCDIFKFVKQCFTSQQNNDEDLDEEIPSSLQVQEEQRVIEQPSTQQHLPIFNTIRLPQIPIVTLSSMRIDVSAKDKIPPESKQIEDVVDDIIGNPVCVIDRPNVTIEQNMVAEPMNVEIYSVVPSCQFINHIPPTIPQVNVEEFDILGSLFEIDTKQNNVSDRQVVWCQPKTTDYHVDPSPKTTTPNQVENSTKFGQTQLTIYHPTIASIQEDVLALTPSAETLDCPIQVEKEVVISEPTPVNSPTAAGVENEFLPYFMDVSLETCHPMSETYNTVRRCAVRGNLFYDRKYAIIGSLDGSKVATEFLPHALPEEHPFSIAATLMSNAGFNVMIGRWNLVGQPTAILIEVQSAFHILGHCKGLLESDGGLDIQDGDFLANYSLVFGFLVGHFIAMVGDIVERQTAAASLTKDPVLVHFHEWSSAAGLLFLKQGNIFSATTFYTSHQLPIDSFIKTAFDINWINHRAAIEELGQLSASLYVPNIPEEGEDLHQLYFRAYEDECRLKRTWHFDVTYNVNLVICQRILTHAASAKALQYEGRHVIVIPYQDQWKSTLDSVDHQTIEGPIGLAIQAMKLRGYKTVVGHLKIPSRPLVILFDTGPAKEELVTKLKHEMRNYSVSPESLADFCTLEKVFDYLVTAFFSIFNHESDRVDNIPGEAYPKVIRQYYIRDESC